MTTVKLNGKDVQLKVCPECGQEALTLLIDFATGRRFCHECHGNPNSGEATVARKLHENAVAGTLESYPVAERIADLKGKT
jgi:hypothetical protein